MTLKKIKNITPVQIKNPKTVDLNSPWDLKIVGHIECIEKKHVDEILNIASKAFHNKAKPLNKIERIKILKKCKSKLEKNSQKFSKIIALEGGKPLKDAKIEVERAINGVDLCVEALNKCSGSEIPMNISNSSLNKIAFTKKFPIGPVFAVSAFNHPLNLIVHQVGPAIAAGCPVIIKPSLDTPLSCYVLIKI